MAKQKWYCIFKHIVLGTHMLESKRCVEKKCPYCCKWEEGKVTSIDNTAKQKRESLGEGCS